MYKQFTNQAGIIIKPTSKRIGPGHMALAESHLGRKEIPGAESDPIIDSWFTYTTLGRGDDDMAYCSAFVTAMLEQAGLPSTKSAAAQSYMNWGIETSTPKYGDIAVIRYPNTWKGHVGFVHSFPADRPGFVKILGANQNDEVNLQAYRISEISSFRTLKTWPMSTTNIAASVGMAATVVPEVVAVLPNQEVITAVTDAMLPPEWQPAIQLIIQVVSFGYVIWRKWQKLKVDKA